MWENILVRSLDKNLGNCECECDKLCDVGEYLDYENCKCREN